MTVAPEFSVEGKLAILATMHRKEQVMRPLLERGLGLRLSVPVGFDTDRFGTFSHDISRKGSQLDAARAKIEAAFDDDDDAVVAIASEGSFGPHPLVPFLPLGREMVVMRDRESGMELIGQHADMSANFLHEAVDTLKAAARFAERVGFPRQGLIVLGSADGSPAPDLYLNKEVVTAAELSEAVREAIAVCGMAYLETDMRAHRNPTRMRAIRRATIDLVRSYRSACPQCAHPGFVVTEHLYGLPCSWCGEPTNELRAKVLACGECGRRVEQPVQKTTVEPGQCSECNP